MKIILILILLLFISGCATLFFPSRLEEQPEGTEYVLDVPMIVVDVVLWGPFAVVYDFITGAIWVPYPPEPLWPTFEDPGQG